MLTIALAGAMVALTYSYINSLGVSSMMQKSELSNKLQSITTTLLQCKDLSSDMPKKEDKSKADDDDLSSLECQSDPTYKIDSGKGGFIPSPPKGFSTFKAKEENSSFYVSTTAKLNSTAHSILKEMKSNYSASQFELEEKDGEVKLKFYIFK